MRLSQIIIIEAAEVDYTGIDTDVAEKLKSFPSHYQQWGLDALRKGQNANSVLDALVYYKSKISDNRFLDILKKITPTPRNILTLSLDQIKTAQSEFDSSFGGASKRELKKLRRSNYAQTLVDKSGFKIIKFDKLDETDNAAKILSDYARGTKWCVTDISIGDHYLSQGPIYLIYKSVNFVTDPDNDPPLDTDGTQLWQHTDKMLCHMESKQLMDPADQPVYLFDNDLKDIRPFIPHVSVFTAQQFGGHWHYSVSEAYNQIRRYSSTGPWSGSTEVKEFLKAALNVPSKAVEVAKQFLSRFSSLNRWPEAEPNIMKDPLAAVDYAVDVLKSRWKDAEPTIAKNAVAANKYIQRLNFLYRDADDKSKVADLAEFQNGWPLAEPAIHKVAWVALDYTKKYKNEPSSAAEKILFETLDKMDEESDRGSLLNYAIDYAARFYKGGWPQLEEYLAHSYKAALYCQRVTKRRWPEAEPYIMEAPISAATYAVDVMKHRWPEAEQTIRKDEYARQLYVKAFGVEGRIEWSN